MRPNNLPQQLTRFIGRESDIEALKRMLAAAEAPDRALSGQSGRRKRLVTLTGVGGCGKTRLVIEVAGYYVRESPAAPFADGITFIELASLSDPARLAAALAATLNLHENPRSTPVETLLEVLRARDQLLILDNCEHLLEACAHLAAVLLRACPSITILTTSRAPLDIPGETVFRVPALKTLNPDERQPVTNVLQSDAVLLFMDRVKATQPGLTLTEPQMRAVLQICRRLDGIPLAIELAAARTAMLTPQQILRRLDDIFHLLHSTSQETISRHRSLHATFDWSYSLLGEHERTLFRRLSIFAGGWALDAAEQITGFAPLALAEIIDLHQRLFEHSLITRTDDGRSARSRYRLLEPVRQYAAEKLAQTAEYEQLCERRLDYFTELSNEAWSGIISGAHESWEERLELDLDNIRAALKWALENGAVDKGLSMVTALFHFWLDRHHLLECIEITRQLLAREEAATPSAVRARALAFLSLSYMRMGDHQQAIGAANESLAIERILPNPQTRAFALAGLGHAYALQGAYAAGISLLEESLALFQAQNFSAGQGWTLSRLGTVALIMGDYERATYFLSEMTRLMVETGNTLYLGYALRYWGYALFYQGDHWGALIKFRELLVNEKSLGFGPATLAACAMAAAARGQIQQAARLLGAVQTMRDATQIVFLPYDKDQYEHTSALVRAQFNNPAVSEAWEKGRLLTPQQASSEALALCESLLAQGASLTYPAGLTQREVEVLQLLAQGLTNQQIANQLVISRRTVHAHLRSIFSKLEVHTRTAAAQEASRLNLA